MNNIDNVDIKEKIKSEYNYNEIKIKEISDEIFDLQKSEIEIKLLGAFGMSGMYLFILIFFAKTILKLGLIPLEPLFVIFPVVFGTLTASIAMKKTKDDEDATSYTQKEIIEEEIRYRIELEKYKNRNRSLSNYLNGYVIDKDIDNLIINKNTYLSSKEDISKNIEKEKELITKYVLSSRFWSIRDNLKRLLAPFIFGVIGALCFLAMYDVPMFIAKSIQGLEYSTSILSVFVPAIIGGVLCTGIGIEKNRDSISVYNKLNDELGENKISKKENTYEDQLAFELEMQESIDNSCHLKIMQYIDTKKSENLKDKSEKIIEEDYQAYTLESQPKGEIKDYYLEGEFEHKSDEVLERELPGEEQVKVRRLTNK